VTIVAKARRDPALLVGQLRQVALRTDPELAILDAGTGAVLSGARNLMPKIIAALTGLLGVLALAMAGLYGVLSYVVAGRTREVGVRMALGATRPRTLALVLLEGIRPVLEGVAVGLGMAAFAAVALRPAFERMLPAVDPAVFTLLPIPFVIAALVACYLPARRAASVDPNVALRRL
jgi:putative ABC transport system permease protein